MTVPKKRSRGKKQSGTTTPTHIQQDKLKDLIRELGPDHEEVKRLQKQIQAMERGFI